MKNAVGVIFLLLLIPFTNLHSQNQIFLEDGGTLSYTNLKVNGKQPNATISSDSENKTLSKEEVLGFTNHNGALYTFNLRSGRKFKVKEKGAMDDACFKARLHAYKYFRYKDNAPSVQTEAPCYEDQTKKLRTRSTVGAVGGGVAFALGLSLFISSVSQASSL